MIISELTLRSIIRRSILQQMLTEADLSYSGILGDKFQTLSGAVTDASKAKQLSQDLSTDINNFIKKASSIKSVQDFFTSKTESLRAIELENKKYIAYGYYTVDDKECVVIQVQKKNHQDMMKKGAKLLEAGKSYNIKNHGSSSNITLKKNEKNAYYALPVKTQGIKFTADKLKSGSNSAADWSVEFLSILGGIPVAGLGFDAAAATIALMKDPPDYIIAAFCLLFALPIEAITLLYGFRKQAELAMKASTASMEQQTKILAKMIADEAKRLDLGENIMRNIVATGRQTGETIIRELKEPAVLGRLAKISGKSTQQLASNVDEFSDVWKKLLDNMTDEGAEAGGKAVAKETKSVLEKQVKETTEKVLKDLSSGGLRSVIEETSRNLRATFANNFGDAVQDSFEAAVRKHKNSTSKLVDMNIAIDFFQDATNPIIGKKIPLPDPPGGFHVFKNWDEFYKTSQQLMSITGMQFSDVMTKTMENVLEASKKYEMISDENLSIITDNIIDRFSNLKIKITSDVEASSSVLRLKTSTGTTFGYSNFIEGVIAINVEALEKRGLNPAQIDQLFTEEMTHAVDSIILSAVAAGDDFCSIIASNSKIQAEIRNKYFRSGSDVIAEKIFTNPTRNKAARFTTQQLTSTLNSMENYWKDKPTKEFIQYLKELGSSDKQRVEKLCEVSGLPEFHASFMVDFILARPGMHEKLPLSVIMERLNFDLSYLGNPPEFLVRARYLADKIKETGLNPRDKDDIVKFFKSFKSHRDFETAFPYLENGRLFIFIHDAVTNERLFTHDIVLRSLMGFSEGAT